MDLALDRRRFLALAGGAAAAAAVPAWSRALPATPDASFSFLFITDTHLQPELDGIHGVELAMREARGIPADFCIQGGDHVMDALGVSKARATQLFDQYAKTEQDLGLKVHHTLGNHDIFGIYPASGTGPADPDYGKKMFEARFGPTYYAFDHKGVHFVVLDSVGITDDRHYEARIDDTQLAWLAKDLGALPRRAPVVVTTHIPLVTALSSYMLPIPRAAKGESFINGPATVKLLSGYNVLGVLQGHTHVNETVLWQGIPFITSGAVCGNLWHGARLGTPEGFSVVTIAGGKLTARYVPTGFHTVDPQNT